MVFIEIKIPKEIRNYYEAVFFGLSVRQFVCSLLAIGVAVGLYFLLSPLLGSEEVGWLCILGAAPFAACGFLTYHGMTAEQLLWAWIKSEVLFPKRLVYRSDDLYWQAMQAQERRSTKQPRKRKHRKGQKHEQHSL